MLEFSVLQFKEEYGPKVRVMTTTEVETLMKRYKATIKATTEEKEERWLPFDER
jgi:hypothetical protein